MQIRHLQYFAEIVRVGSISKAARNLYISPQALSAVIANLEAELGYPILNRTRQGVSATDAGRVIYEDLQNILPTIGKWMELGNANPVTSIDLYVSLAMTASMNRFLVKLEKSHPEISISLHEARGTLIIEKIEKNPHSMAVLSMMDSFYYDYVEKLNQKGIQLTKLSEDRFGVVVGKDYFPEIHSCEDMENCRNMSYIYHSDSTDPISKVFLKHFGQRLSAKVESHASILCMAALNQGAIILPQKAVMCEPLYRLGMLRVLQLPPNEMSTSHYLVSMKDELLGEEELCLKKLIIEHYRSTEWEK